MYKLYSQTYKIQLLTLFPPYILQEHLQQHNAPTKQPVDNAHQALSIYKNQNVDRKSVNMMT